MIDRLFVTFGPSASAEGRTRVAHLHHASEIVRDGRSRDVLVDCARVPELGEPALTLRLDGIPLVTTGVAAYCSRHAGGGSFLLSSDGHAVPAATGGSAASLEAREIAILRGLSDLEGGCLARTMNARARDYLTRRNAGLSRLRCQVRLLIEAGGVEEAAGRKVIARISELLRGSGLWL